MNTTEAEKKEYLNFIHQIIEEDLKNGKHGGRVHTRFPPEPNGYLHIGHAKAICLNFNTAEKYKGLCNLRFDDTNPAKEEEEYVTSIKEDVHWLGFDWGDRLYWASDYFQQMYDFAIEMIRKGKAYVCDLTPDEIREYRGTPTEKGKNSPFRDRSVEENLILFEKMKKGEFPNGSRTLRAKIDMSHPNMNMRDPIMYRIVHATHHNTGDQWCVYPMYDWAHGLEDSIEGITHSLCTLEFEDHRPLYDWFLDQLEGVHRPQQIEFARLNLNFTVMSKRKLLELVRLGLVKGWDDPRMPTISGMRRRGFPAAAIRDFADRIGLAKRESTVDVALLEFCVREELNRVAERRMAVLNPVKVVITNYPAGQVEMMEAVNNPEDEGAGTRQVPFSREIYIEKDDFMENPPKKFYRLAPGREVRLRYAYLVTCTNVIKDEKGEILEIHCTYDPETRGGNTPDGRKVKTTLHWVSCDHAVQATIRQYDRLFKVENPLSDPEKDYKEFIHEHSLDIVENCQLEPDLKNFKPGQFIQFERLGYFIADPDATDDNLIFNRTITLRDTWAKIQQQENQK
ncbi:MAG: glutamine--tRNA ligase/YqeY domain fusion protein [Candidatus Marinimicrobia bacterium]|nr:glutamine--tRNA ligase/YqeY domain fusion protein [Candidatus Neomarinimicrobiota bacterium]